MTDNPVATARAIVENGGTRQAAATAAGVSRQTVHRWQALQWRVTEGRPSSPAGLAMVETACRLGWSGGELHRAMLDAGIRCSESQARRLLAARRREVASDGD